MAQRVEDLKEENTALREELDNFKKEYDELLAQNASLKVYIYIYIASSCSIQAGSLIYIIFTGENARENESIIVRN